MSGVQGGSVCGPSTLWRFEVAVVAVRRSFSRGSSVSLVETLGYSFSTSCVSRVDSALCLTPLVLRESCLARP
ncbi:hypothetical protein Taro_038656 [Colocasia esculenta]|uniref:Uncharacterized protein n=1 Tax=Colocasia esculenta TaxID=4460 RepID=A0A843WTB3_COLES|nr:hypothetical protein [Colocasia esculenta]